MRWEYKIVEVGDDKGSVFKSKTMNVDALNDLGAEGWELVNTVSVSGAAAGFGTKPKPDQVFMIFKRPL